LGRENLLSLFSWWERGRARESKTAPWPSFYTLVHSEERSYTVRSRIEVGDLVLVRRDGRRRSAAARKYAGKKGQVTMRGAGHDRTVVDVRIDQNNFDTVFEEQDLIKSLSIS
jgi:hypothetical protein